MTAPHTPSEIDTRLLAAIRAEVGGPAVAKDTLKAVKDVMADLGLMIVPGWRPIESAPRDGRVVLLTSTDPSWKYPFPAKWGKAEDRWIFADYPLNDIWGVSDLVTHWAPLPTPPAALSAEPFETGEPA